MPFIFPPLFLSDGIAGGLLSTGRRSHEYKFEWLRYPHGPAWFAPNEDRLRPQAGGLQKNGENYGA